MENKVSDKIRLLLNELAILNQPESKNGKIFYRIEDLRRIRSLSAELYLLCDMASKQGEIFHPEPVAAAPEMTVVEEVVSAPEPSAPAAPEAPVVVSAPAPEEMPVALEEPLAEEISVEELVHSHEPAPEVVEAHPNEKPRYSADHLSAQFSLTRRFEYINNLFGGNAELFMEFLDEITYCKSPSEAVDVFDRHYEQKNWRRKEETADDFKRMIRKFF